MFVSVIFYFSTEYTGWIKTADKKAHSASFSGETVDVGKFGVKLELGKSEKPLFLNQLTGNITVAHLKESLIKERYFKILSSKAPNLKEYVGFNSGRSLDIQDSNFIAYQVKFFFVVANKFYLKLIKILKISGFLPFEFEVMFESESLREELKSRNEKQPPELKGEEFDSSLSSWHGQFAEKFEEKFKLKEKGFSSSAIIMAQCALSNMVGSIGFFTGQSIVTSINNKEPVLYWESNLYTGVPSRSFFPRGFLWDEGFHNILISHWDLDITKDIIGHWLDLMNVEGKIKHNNIF